MAHDGQSKRTLGNVFAQLLLSACVLLVPPLLMVASVMRLNSSPEGAGQQVDAERADKRPELAASLAPARVGQVISERRSVVEEPAASTQTQVVKDSTRFEDPVTVGDGSEPTADVKKPQTAVVADLSSKVPEQLPADKRRSPARSATPYLPDTVAALEEAQPASRPNESGNWVVQLSAQRTEEEAQAAFRAAQAKYATLAGRQVLIRKKDQGGRGVFYAAQVGPLTHDEANGLCNQIKRGGGNCFIQAN